MPAGSDGNANLSILLNINFASGEADQAVVDAANALASGEAAYALATQAQDDAAVALASGEFAHYTALLVDTKVDRKAPWISVEEYGATSSDFPTTDNTTAIQNALDAASTLGTANGIRYTTIIPPGKYKITSTITVPNNVDLWMVNSMLVDYDSSPKVILEFAHQMNRADHRGISVAGNQLADLVDISEAAEATWIAVRVNGARNSRIGLAAIGNTSIGIQFKPTSNASYVGYNEIYGGSFWSVRTAIDLRGTSDGASWGWVNENTISGQNISIGGSGTLGRVVGVRFSHEPSGDRYLNNNRFENICFQVQNHSSGNDMTPGMSLVSGRRYINRTLNLEYIATATTTGPTPIASHTSGTVSSLKYVGHYFRCPVFHEDGCGQQNLFKNCRWESGDGPFAMVQQSLDLNVYVSNNEYGVQIADQNARAFPPVDLHTHASYSTINPCKFGFHTFNESPVEQFLVDDLDLRYISSSTGVCVQGVHWLGTGGSTVPTQYISHSAASSPPYQDVQLVRLCDGWIVNNASSSPGVFVDATKNYTRFEAVRFAEGARTNAGGELLLAIFDSTFARIQPSASTSTNIVTNGQSYDATNKIWTFSNDTMQFANGSDANLAYYHVGLYYASQAQSRSLLIIPQSNGKNSYSKLSVFTAFESTAAKGQRFSYETPKSGVFKRVGEIITNLNTASGQPMFWVVKTAGRLAPPWGTSEGVYLNELRRADTNRIYAANSTATTHASGSGPTGTGSAASDGTMTWRYLSQEAVLVSGPTYP